MSISQTFIQRPIMTTLVMFMILFLGVIAYSKLPVSDLPNVDYPTIQVSAQLPGANADTMASAVATPLEKEFSTIAGVDNMTSSSTLGNASITLQFSLNRNIDAAALDVQIAISRAVRKLPAEMPNPPSFRKVNPADQPILFLSLTSLNLPMSVLDEYGQSIIAQRISMIDGVAQVQVFGSQKYAVRIKVDPNELASRGIGIDEVSDRINDYNVNLALGSLDGPFQGKTILANGQLMDASKYMPLVIAYRNGQPVRLQDVGTAVDGVENDKQAAWYVKNGVRDRAIILAIQRQPGTNTVAVADAIKALLPMLREKLPAALTLEVMRDNSLPIRDSAHDVQFTLLLTLGLVVMVIFLFLRNFSATVIPSLVLPMSIVGTFAVMYVLNYSLDNLSLMALTLSVGFVVDDAIVMLENIVRHMEMGKGRMQAALEGSREIGFTIVSMTISLAAVFIPVLFMGGLVGRLFREFAVTIGAAVLVSGAVSLTLTPMLASRFLKDQHKIHHGLVYRVSEAGFQAMLKFYDWTLGLALRNKATTMAVSLAILGGTVWLFYKVPMGFIPSEDRGWIMIGTESAQDASFASLVQHHLDLAAVVEKNPNVDSFMVSTSAGGGGRFGVVLKPRDQRTETADEVVAELRQQLAVVPGIRAMPQNPPAINVGGRQSRSPYQLTVQGVDTDELYDYAGKLEQRIRELPDFLDVSSDVQLKNPQVNVVIDRDAAFIRNLTPLEIENALSYAYSVKQVSTIYAPNNQYQVILEVLDKYQTNPEVLNLLYVRSSTGQLVPLKAVTTLSEDVGPLSINHSGQLPSATISFNLRSGVALSQAVEKVNEITRGNLPAGMTCNFQGTAQAFNDSIRSMGWLLVLAVVVIYVVLGILYESFYHPITILSALPFAGFGALLTLWLFNVELSLYAFVGIIMLIGLVKKNGIMMVDFALQAQREEGKDATAAIHEACLVRFRPIMMTTMAALMAGIPIAAGFGAGAESRRPLGLAVVGGLLFSQTLTLYVTPVIYVLMEWLRNAINGESPSSPAVPQVHLPPPVSVPPPPPPAGPVPPPPPYSPG